MSNYKTVGVAKTAKYMKQRKFRKAKEVAYKYQISVDEFNDAITNATKNINNRYNNLISGILKSLLAKYAVGDNALKITDRQFKDLQYICGIGFDVDFKEPIQSFIRNNCK